MSSRPDLEANPRVRYGFYLRPSAEMSRAQCDIHDLLHRQFGFETAGMFMPHATIMSFFRSDAPIESIVGVIDPFMAGRESFPVWNGGVIRMGVGAVLDVQHLDDGASANPSMRSLHDAAFAAIAPLVHPSCEFAFGDWSGDRFHAHLTLAMADVPHWAVGEMLEFLRELEQIGPAMFQATHCHLYAFKSDDWGGQWWETMTWEFLHSWRMEG